MNSTEQGVALAHRIEMENRTRVTITSVQDVDSFHEEEVDLVTSAGLMRVMGRDLHIRSLDLEAGTLVVEGELDAVAYAPRQQQPEGFLSRLFH